MSFSFNFEDSISRSNVWDALDTLGIGRDHLVYESGNMETSECYKLYRDTCVEILNAMDRMWDARQYFSKDMVRAIHFAWAVRAEVYTYVARNCPNSQGDFAVDLPQDFYIVLF